MKKTLFSIVFLSIICGIYLTVNEDVEKPFSSNNDNIFIQNHVIKVSQTQVHKDDLNFLNWYYKSPTQSITSPHDNHLINISELDTYQSIYQQAEIDLDSNIPQERYQALNQLEKIKDLYPFAKILLAKQYWQGDLITQQWSVDQTKAVMLLEEAKKNPYSKALAIHYLYTYYNDPHSNIYDPRKANVYLNKA